MIIRLYLITCISGNVIALDQKKELIQESGIAINGFNSSVTAIKFLLLNTAEAQSKSASISPVQTTSSKDNPCREIVLVGLSSGELFSLSLADVLQVFFSFS